MGDIVLRDRKQLSEDGMLVIVLTMSKGDKKLLSGPDTITRGFVYVRDSEELLNEMNRLIDKTLKDLKKAGKSQWSTVKQTIKKTISDFLYVRTKRRPMILPIIIEI